MSIQPEQPEAPRLIVRIAGVCLVVGVLAIVVGSFWPALGALLIVGAMLLIAAVILLAPYCRPQIVWTAATQETSASCIATNSSNQSMKPTAHYDITAVCLP